jgi:hypothetical protein
MVMFQFERRFRTLETRLAELRQKQGQVCMKSMAMVCRRELMVEIENGN